MSGVLEAVASLLLIAMVLKIILAALLGGLYEWRSWRLLVRLGRRVLGRPETEAPPTRPIEQIAADVRRISVRYHQDGMRFAQYEGRRQAYDRVLAEAADTLDIPHLVGVLPPGAELDRERLRVETLLVDAGVLPHAA
ncbi:hypothetical protein [Nocardioides euryhalodurans]|uniref:Uncharacterized protein n=1 Tax=Nocardioides euryhalodurans TaxID=2518370 RepID=A0A4P7GNM7_9ACTN|nr:hypothetical protein [Nocardioides euryhalodurans]QBR93524.1 hypothetical protein EXE57_15545 [Nocardioides euryhalodurans]